MTTQHKTDAHLNAVFSALGITNTQMWMDKSPEALGRLVKSIADRAAKFTAEEAQNRFKEPAFLSIAPPYQPPRYTRVKPFTFPEKGDIV